MSEAAHQPPGRLGEPSMEIVEDPRIDPRIGAALEMFPALGGEIQPTPDATYEQCLAYCQEFEDVGSIGHAELLAALPTCESIEQTTEVIQGVDGNDINLLIHQPRDRSGPLPCIVHLHGGGMVVMTAEDPNYVRWRNSLAEEGMIVIGVEYRNAGGKLGTHPFPAGLNDCATAVQWVDQNRQALGVASVVVSGESGGGNLSLATTLKASQEGWLDAIQGVYAMCPYISGSYLEPPAELPSLIENDGYLLDGVMMSMLVKAYDPSGANAMNPLAWPYHASVEALAGLPPHFISVNELDPLRDEGLAYYRRLLTAGVAAVGRTVHGTPHGGDMVFGDVAPDIYNDSVRSVAGFVKSL